MCDCEIEFIIAFLAELGYEMNLKEETDDFKFWWADITNNRKVSLVQYKLPDELRPGALALDLCPKGMEVRMSVVSCPVTQADGVTRVDEILNAKLNSALDIVHEAIEKFGEEAMDDLVELY